MSKGTLIFLTGLVLFVSVFRCFGQEKKSTVRLVFYNTENFFDTADDTSREDNDFLPDGIMRWTRTRYKTKVNSIYKVITAAGEWEPPAITGLCEIENRSVLHDLTANTYLQKYEYGIIHEESPDPRGIDVGIIFRKDKVKLITYRYLIPRELNKAEFRTRSVLYSKWLILGDTIHLFLNHWPSKRGGALAGERIRRSIAIMINLMSDSISASNHESKIIIDGDFNCTPDDNDILLLTKQTNSNSEAHNSIVNLSEADAARGNGSYKFSGSWEMIDQVLVSTRLLNSVTGLYTESGLFRIFNPGFLLIEDKTYPGQKPFSTYTGYSYTGGFSDHLPVILDLKKK